MDELLKVFDAWEDLIKARKAKGLDNWAKLEHLAGKLAGKHGKHITFTCSHPKHGKKGETHNLGSNEGNLHFLLGYCNPGFHLAPYHWQIIYPDLDEEDAVSFAAQQGHPAQPRLWEKSSLDVFYEGDLEEGKPHAHAQVVRSRKEAKERSIKATSRYASYEADPVERVVRDTTTGKVYKWELVENSYFAYENPKIVEAMLDTKPVLEKSHHLPEMVRQLSKRGRWSDDVYPLVKSVFPKPGSVILLKSGTETIYGVVGSNSIQMVDEVGNPVKFSQYDREYEFLDLRKGGDINPSILYNFAVTYAGVDGEHLTSLVKSQDEPARDDFPSVVQGLPSRGWDDVPATYEEGLNKSVEVRGHTHRVIVED